MRETDLCTREEVNRMSLTYRGLAMLAFTLVSLVWLAGCGSGSSQDGAEMPDTVRIGYQIVPNAALVAKQRGTIEENMGVPVEWVQFDSGASVITAMSSGSI